MREQTFGKAQLTQEWQEQQEKALVHSGTYKLQQETLTR